MKQKIILPFFTLFFSFALIIGCKKGLDKNARTQPETFENQGLTENVNLNLNVSEYNFLIFTTMNSFLDYKNFVLEKTHAEIQDYLNTIGFNPLGETLYDNDFLNEQVTEEQFINYVFNNTKVFQIDGVVFKPIEESNNEVKWAFLLAMVELNLTNSSYEQISEGYFNDTIMDKIATNPESDEVFDIISFVKAHSNGYEDETPTSLIARRPMFGSVTTCQDVPGGCFNAQTASYDPCSYVKTKKYFFWLLVSDGNGPQDGPKSGSCAFNGY